MGWPTRTTDRPSLTRRGARGGLAFGVLAAAAIGLHSPIVEGAPAVAIPRSDAAAPTAPSALPAPTAPPPPSAPADTNLSWRQTLAAQVTGSLRALAVDPTDAKQIWVGALEGTLYHSLDGGITWEDVALSPFLQKSPTPGIGFDGDGYQAIGPFAGLPIGGPGRPGAGKGVGPAGGPTFWRATAYYTTSFRIDGPGEPLLGAVAGAYPWPYQEVTRLKLCPGGERTIFVLTKTRLFGSPDGVTFVPLFATRDSVDINDVACSPANPQEVILATTDGTFRSVDAGSTFEPIAGQLGAMGSNALLFAPTKKEKETLLVATGSDLWMGDPNTPGGLHYVPVTAGTGGDIRSIAASPRWIWLATGNGVRVSHDGGATWSTRGELDGYSWDAIAVAETASGTEHVEVLRNEGVWGSVDGGLFQPSFRGESRNPLKQIAAAADGSFLVVTTNELWTTSPLSAVAAAKGDPAYRWAMARLRRMPSLKDTTHRCLVEARLTDAQIDSIVGRSKTRAWLPGVGFNFSLGQVNIITATNSTIVDPSDRVKVESERTYRGGIDLVWELPDLVSPGLDPVSLRSTLYELRKRMSYVIMDAYDERRQALLQMTSGGLDIEQLLNLQTKVEVLDVVIARLTGSAGD